jgi:hypothetical protein
MSRVRPLLISLLGAVALGAILAPIASAASPEWWIEKSLFGEGKEALAETTAVTTPFKLGASAKEGSVKFVIECEGVKLKKAAIEGPSSRSEEAVIFEKCIAVGKPECTVATIESKPLMAALEGSPGAITLKFKPKSGSEIAAYTISGAKCAVAGSYRADGTMICNYSGVETESSEHPLEFTSTSGSKVTVGGIPVEFTGTDKVHLASNKLWSAQ